MEKKGLQQTEVLRTKLKFIRSSETGAMIGFISQNPKTGRISGVRRDSEFPKKICVVDKKLSPLILINTLYDVAMVPMSKKNGYVVTEATPVQFDAVIETSYVPKGLYRIEVKFGNKTIVFDPLDGYKTSVKTIEGCLALLEKRVDIKNINGVLKDFEDAAHKLLNKYEMDGFINVKKAAK